MANKEVMMKKIVDAVKDQSFLTKVHEELELMSITDGLDDKNNLDVFYNLWQKNKSRVGHSNKINSWTAFAIGMTTAKPVGDFLPPRRAFARAGFPDIDTDFDDENRDEVFVDGKAEYGAERVAKIGTYQALKLKSCVRRVGKVLDIANAFHKGKDSYTSENEAAVTEVLKSIPGGAKIKVLDEDGKEKEVKNIRDAYKLIKDFRHYMNKFPDLFKHGVNIEGILSSFSTHASGVVISDVPLHTIAPLRISRKNDFATQFAYEDLETVGLIKFDILAIATLTVIKETLKMINQNYEHIDIDIENLPLDDEKTLALYRTGNLAGVFQCESRPMQSTMRQIGVDSFDDIMAAISLFRPGPLESIPEYCARKKGEKKVDYFHPKIEPHVTQYLKRTYGVLVYQEQIMQICNSLAGFSVTDGYVVIKAIGKKKQYLMDKFAKQFVEGCKKKEVPEEVAKQYWEKFIVPFAGYGFNACLDGSMRIKDEKTGEFMTVEKACEMFSATEASIMGDPNRPEVYLKSCLNGEMVDDQLLDVFETGEKEVFEVEMDNGVVIRASMDHKFYCSDGIEHTLRYIVDNDLEIIYE